jgi:hypothetical protein
MKFKALPAVRLRAVVLAIFAMTLTWLVVARSLAAYLADVAPQWALLINPQEPEALVNLADRSINSSGNAAQPAGLAENSSGKPPPNASAAADGGETRALNNHTDFQALNDAFKTVDQNRSVDIRAIAAEAETSLINEPLNAPALRILGQLADISNDNDDALMLMAAAARMSLHESAAILWLMHKYTETGDYNKAIFYADILLRTDPGLAQSAVPTLAHFAENKASNGAVKAVLEGNPPWRGLFFRLLPESITDARTPFDLLVALRTTSTPPTSDDISRYIEFLVQHKFYDLAYYTWLQFLPAEELRSAGLLFNGNFEVAPSGAPFNWIITQGSGVTVDIVPRSDKIGAHALLVDFLYGRVDYHSVTELLALAPGAYQFDGEYRGNLVGSRGLQWRIVCADDANARIGESPTINGVTSSWEKTGFTFTVPAEKCRAQYVSLDLDARMASETLVSGSILFDDLHISRVVSARPGSVN